MFCRASGGAGIVALMSNLSGCSPARALPVSLILRSAPITRFGVDAVDTIVDPVARIGKYNGAVGHGDPIDRQRVRIVLAGAAPSVWTERLPARVR